jgi:hypothetical protein
MALSPNDFVRARAAGSARTPGASAAAVARMAWTSLGLAAYETPRTSLRRDTREGRE